MRIPDVMSRALELSRAARSAAWRAKTVAQVGWRTGLTHELRGAGLFVLARDLPRGKANPSLIFRFRAANSPNQIAVVGQRPGGGERAWSYFEMDEALDKIAGWLHRRGFRKGDAAVLALKNRTEFLFLQAAIGRIGGAAVSTSWRGTAREIGYVAKHSGAKIVFFDAEIADVARAARSEIGLPSSAFVCVGGGTPVEDEIAFERLLDPAPAEVLDDASEEGAVVMYTSGTTGKPKGAVRKFQKDALASALAFVGETPMRAGDVHLTVCPLYHATAFGFVGLSFLMGGRVVVAPGFDPIGFLELVQKHRITTTAVVPTMLHRLVELGPDVLRKYDTSSLRAIFSGGAPLSGPLAKQAMDLLGDKVFNFYGATETGLVTIATPEDLRRSPGTIGHAVPGCEIRLLDDAGRDAPPGGVGELYVKSSMLVQGYHADDAATRDSMRDGFFSVGDLARRDSRGCFHIEGRKRDMIISGGVNVYPAEVEEVLHEHPSVSEVAVVGAPDPEWGERVRAFVVAKKGAEKDVEILKTWCKARLAGPKVPRDFVFLDELPRNPTGKVLKRELRTMQVPG